MKTLMKWALIVATLGVLCYGLYYQSYWVVTPIYVWALYQNLKDW